MSEAKKIEQVTHDWARLRRAAIGTLVGAALAVAGAASAHHSFAVFDMSQQKTIEGTVSDFQWTNPHTWTWVNVKGADGKLTRWGLEGMSPSWLGRRGWGNKSLAHGQKIKVIYYPLRDGRPGGFFVRVTGPDGKELQALPGRAPPPPSK